MMPVKLIYFDGCPNIDRIRTILRSVAAVTIEEVRQDLLHATDSLRNYSSPTVLCGDSLIFGIQTNAPSACSIETIEADAIRHRLARLLQTKKRKG
jgi:hypothetical protein